MSEGAGVDDGSRAAQGRSDAGQTALSGVRVLDLGRVLAAPFCGMILADLGAEVIKIEHAERGDDTRAWKPPEAGGESAYYLSINRNKRSVGLDLSTEAGRRVVHELVARSDVVLENFRPGVTTRLGVDYATLSALTPRLIYCSISGFGQQGPMAGRAAYDYVVQAMSGVMSLTGERDGVPVRCAGAIADYGTGLYAVISILFSLMERARTGRGQHIDLAMLDCAMTYLGHTMTQYLTDGEPPRRLGNGHEKIVPMDVYETADEPLMVLCGNDGMFRRLVRAMGHPEAAEDPRFATNLARSQNLGVLEDFMREGMRRDTREGWMRRLAAADIPFVPVRSIAEVMAAPEVLERNMLAELPHPTAGRIKVVGSPLKLSESPVRLDRRPPPLLGEHTEQVLRELLGKDDADIEQLRASGALGKPGGD
ncbi:MAG: CoA transferase [Gammaproteobacteria bacterium]|nr:CoA transferase [Gammaproteobacteria bacterium]